MTIAYRDFAPRELSPAAFLRPATYEPFSQAVAAANEWIAAEAVQVMNVETVALPNLWGPHSQGTEDPDIGARSDFPVMWNQFVRVWYER